MALSCDIAQLTDHRRITLSKVAGTHFVKTSMGLDQFQRKKGARGERLKEGPSATQRMLQDWPPQSGAERRPGSSLHFLVVEYYSTRLERPSNERLAC